MGDPAVIGEIVIFAGNYPPMGWAYCDGRLLPISQYSALFAVIGTRYGGDGINNFALPDLRGRTPLGMGTGPGLTLRSIAEQGGLEKVGLSANDLPAHTHNAQTTITGNLAARFTCLTVDGTSSNPSGGFIAKHTNAFKDSGTMGTMNNNAVTLNPGALTFTTAVGNAGNNIPHENMHPAQVVNYIIALEGIFPQRP